MITLKHFTASWCKPCEKLISIMDEITNDYPDIEYINIDGFNNKQAKIKNRNNIEKHYKTNI